jgi:hypothetical protein
MGYHYQVQGDGGGARVAKNISNNPTKGLAMRNR